MKSQNARIQLAFRYTACTVPTLETRNKVGCSIRRPVI